MRTRGTGAAEEATGLADRTLVAPKRVVLIASLGAFMAFVDATIVNIAFPDIQASFPESSISSLSWVFNAYNIAFAALLVAAGRVADLLGRRRVFRAGIVIFTLASLGCALASSAEFLIFARIVQAVGAAIVVPASLALVMEAFPAERQTHGVALWTATAALAAGIGPSLGGVLVDLADWRLAFLVNIPVGAIAYVAAGRGLVESRAPGRRAMPDLPGTGLLALAIGLLTLAIIKGPEWGWADGRVLAAAALSVALGVVFVRRCGRHRSPVLDLDLFRRRSFAIANALTVIGAAGFFSYLLCNVLFLTSVWGYSVLDAGLALTPGPLIAAAVAGPFGKLATRVDFRVLLVPGALIWGLGLLYLATRVGTEPRFLAEWLPGMAILGVGAGISFPILTSASIAAAPGERFATATALNSVARQVGAVLGVALLVAIVGSPAPLEAPAAFDDGWIFGAACMLSVGLGALGLGRLAAQGEGATAAAVPAATAATRPLSFPVRPARATPRPLRAADSPAAALKAVPLFAELDQPTREGLAERTSTVELEPGGWLCRAGDPGESLYIVCSGRLEVMREDDGAAPTREIGPGTVVGELALVTDSPRAASIRARRHSVLLELRRDDFERLLEEVPALWRVLTRQLGEALRQSRPATLEPSARPATIALVALEPNLSLARYAEALEGALSEWGRVARLDLAESGLEPPYGAAVARYEGDHDRLLLVAGKLTEPTPWTDFCLRQADTVLGLTRCPPLTPRIKDGLARARGCELVLCGEITESGSCEWLDALAPSAIHRVPPGLEEAAVARTARRLTGNSIGLVLSGGGARAFAHLGVIEELIAAGIEIDRVGGVSMGAYIGALFASGLEPEAIDARCYLEWIRRNPLNDYTFPKHALIRGHKVREMFKRSLPGTIEAMVRDFYCTSADLRTGTAVVHRRGSAARAVAGSMCLPGLAPALPTGDRLLIDGGFVDNLPVELMADTGEGPVIAVDVTAHRDPSRHNGDRPRPRKGGPWDEDGPPAPPITETLGRLAVMSSIDAVKSARSRADLLIAPPTSETGMFEWHQLDRMRESGRIAAREALETRSGDLFEGGAEEAR